MSDENSAAEIRARLDAYHAVRATDDLDAVEDFLEHADMDIQWLLDALEDTSTEILYLEKVLREIANLLPEHSRLGKDAANFVIEDVGRRARYALKEDRKPPEDDHAESE